MFYSVKKWKQAAGSIVVLLFLFSAPLLAMSYSDTQGHFAENAIRRWSEHEVVKGYEGKFRPNAEVTRGEFAVILNRIMEYNAFADNRNLFSDIGNAYYSDALLRLNHAQIIQGSDGKLRPADQLTREEAAVILVRAFGLTAEAKNTSFQDSGEISNWAENAMAAMTEHGFMKGYKGNVFPKKALTRGELVQLLDNMIALYITKSGEYDGKEIQKRNRAGLIVIKAAQVKIADLKGNYDLITAAGSKAEALQLSNSEIRRLKVADREDEILIVLEKTKIEKVVAKSGQTDLYSDTESKLAGVELKAGSLEAGLKKLTEKNIRFGHMPEPGKSDEYKPIPPSRPSVPAEPGSSEHPNPDPSPQQPDREAFFPLISGLTAKGEYYHAAGKPMVLPDKLPILRQKTGENTGSDIAVSWSGQDLEKARAGIKGRYILEATTTEHVIINEVDYGIVTARMILIIE